LHGENDRIVPVRGGRATLLREAHDPQAPQDLHRGRGRCRALPGRQTARWGWITLPTGFIENLGPAAVLTGRPLVGLSGAVRASCMCPGLRCAFQSGFTGRGGNAGFPAIEKIAMDLLEFSARFSDQLRSRRHPEEGSGSMRKCLAICRHDRLWLWAVSARLACCAQTLDKVQGGAGVLVVRHQGPDYKPFRLPRSEPAAIIGSSSPTSPRDVGRPARREAPARAGRLGEPYASFCSRGKNRPHARPP